MQQFLEGQKELVAAGRPVAVKKATLLLPTRQEGTVAERQGQVRSCLVVESEDEGVAVVVKIKRLALGKVGKGDEDNNNDHNDNNNNNNNNNDDREETPLAERAAVAKAIVRSLDEGEAEARPEAGLSDNG